MPSALAIPNILAAAGANDFPPLVKDLVIILAAAGVVALIMRRLRFSCIPAYLLTGALIGPGGLKIIQDDQTIQEIGEIALILLLFGIGLHMDLGIIRSRWRQLLTASVLSVVMTFLALLPIALLFRLEPAVAITIAMATTMSSTAVVLRILQQRRELHHMDGRLALSALIVQDLAVVGCLLILPPLAHWHTRAVPDSSLGAGSGPETSLLTQSLTQGSIAVLGIVSLVLIGRFILPRILQEAARETTGEAMTVVSVAAALGAAAFTIALDIGPALGAFLGGFMLSSTPFRHHLSGQIGTIRDLFAAVFFTVIGMAVAFESVVSELPIVLLAAILLIVVKAVVITLAIWLAGSPGPVSLKVGLTLAQAGEFGIVILSAAWAPHIGLIPDDLFDQTVAMIAFTLVATPFIINLAPGLAARFPDIPPPRWWRALAGADTVLAAPHSDEPSHVIVAGFGVVGRAVADNLAARGADVTIVELNPHTVRTQARLGRHIVFGDVANPDVLESAAIAEADALILTFPDENAVLRATTAARRLNPDIVIIARTGFLAKGMAATQLGANVVVVEEIATAEAMEKAVEEKLTTMVEAARQKREPPAASA